MQQDKLFWYWDLLDTEQLQVQWYSHLYAIETVNQSWDMPRLVLHSISSSILEKQVHWQDSIEGENSSSVLLLLTDAD